MNKKLKIDFVLKFGDPNHPKTIPMVDAAGIPVLEVKESSGLSGGWGLQRLEGAAPSL